MKITREHRRWAKATRTRVHRLWAPQEATWSPWVKPILFAHCENEEPEAPSSPPSWTEPRVITPLLDFLAREPLADREQHPYRDSARLPTTALILDLPGADGTRVGVALVQHGFHPVPLYNAIPSPLPNIREAVKLDEVMDVLVDHAKSLNGLPHNAPPAFLLDSRRMGNGWPGVGNWDNRSMCFADDFPSPKTLKDHGIHRTLLVTYGSGAAPDLLPILRSWQNEGIDPFIRRADRDGPVEVLDLPIRRTSLFTRLREFFTPPSMPEFERQSDGAFGHTVPEHPAPDGGEPL